MLRLFFAIPIPDILKEKLILGLHRRSFPGIHWVPKDNLHITVHFLGSVPAERIPEITEYGREVSAKSSSFPMRVLGFKMIYKGRKPAMIWAQFEEQEDFEKLCLSLREKLPTDEQRKPNPHATVARIKQLKQLPFDLPEPTSFSFIADELMLYESRTHSEGAEYHTIARWMLG